MPRVRRPVRAVLAGAVLAVVAGCGSGATANPKSLLSAARQTIDNSQAIHFSLTSQGPPPSGLEITGGTGDFARPDSFQGTLDVVDDGLPLHISALSVNAHFWVQLPFTSGFTSANPAKYGFGDPAQLINRNGGITELLTAATSARITGQQRYQGELLTNVSVRLPGPLVAKLLTSKDPSRPASGVFAIDPRNDQVRMVSLTAPFFSATALSTFHLVLSDYGEHVDIHSPA